MLKENIPSVADTGKEIRVFRREAVEAVQRNSWLGHLELNTPLPYWIYTFVSILIAVVLIFLLATFSYTKRIVVYGRLIPSQGLVYVQSLQPGYLGQVLVKPGSKIRKGDVLAIIERKENIITDAAGGNAILQSYAAQQTALRDSLDNQLATLDHELSVLRERANSHDAQIKKLAYEAQVRRRVVDDLERVVESFRERAKTQAVSSLEVQAKEAMANARLEGIRTERLIERERSKSSTIGQRILEKKNEMKAFELKNKIELAELERKKNEYLLKTEGRIVSSVNGTITFVSAHPGEFISVDRQVFGVVPENLDLIAELDIKATEAGLVVEGQQVNLKYDAFPYQRYGIFKAVVSSVDGASYRQDSNQRAIFLSRATLTGTSAESVTRGVNLLPGSTFAAEISIETRKLYEWLILPLQNSAKSI